MVLDFAVFTDDQAATVRRELEITHTRCGECHLETIRHFADGFEGMFTGVAAVSPDRAVAGPENPLSIPNRILDFACDPRLFRCQFRPLAVNLLLFKT